MSCRRSQRLINAKIDKECAICQMEMIFPTKVPQCGHTFCFTCLKSAFNTQKNCPLCRGPVDRSLFDKPQEDIDLKVVCPPEVAEPVSRKRRMGDGASSSGKKGRTSKIYWIYESRTKDVWWRFDPRTEQDIEEAYSNKAPALDIFICGCSFNINFSTMMQSPVERRGAQRAIRRVDSSTFDKLNVKGVAGIAKPE